MAYYLEWSGDSGNINLNSELLQISGISGNLVSIEYALKSDIPAYGSNRYLFDIRRLANTVNNGGDTGWFFQGTNGVVFTNRVSNPTINGVAVAESAFFTALSGDVCKFTVNRTPSGGVVSFGARFNEVEHLYGLAVSEIVLIDAAGTHTISMSSSNGTGSTLTSDTGNITADLLNFPTDNSQWIFYDDGGGTATLDANVTLPSLTATGSASATLPQPTLSASINLTQLSATGSASATLPTPQLSAAITLPSLTAAGSAAATLPNPTLQASITMPIITASGDVSASLPQPTLSANVTLPTITVSGNASATLPGFNLSGNITLPVITATGAAQATLPQPTLTASVTLPTFTVTGSATATEPSFTLSGNVTLQPFTVTGAASATLPQPTLSGNITLPSIQVSGFLVGGEIVITIDASTNINEPQLSTNITEPTLSTNISE